MVSALTVWLAISAQVIAEELDTLRCCAVVPGVQERAVPVQTFFDVVQLCRLMSRNVHTGLPHSYNALSYQTDARWLCHLLVLHYATKQRNAHLLWHPGPRALAS